MPGFFSSLGSSFVRTSWVPRIHVLNPDPNPNEPVITLRASDSKSRLDKVSIRSLIETRCPSLNTDYRPAWCLNNGHLQTFYCVLGDFSKVDLVRYDRTLLRVPDGGTLGLDFTPRASELSLPEDTPIVIVLHGLTGGSYESYVRSILAVACKPVGEGGLGYRGVVVNFRGCADVPLTSVRMYSAGTTEDIATAVLYISRTFPNARLLGLGFSLGANVLTRYIAEEGDKCLLTSGCVLACPWNLSVNSDHLEATLFSRNVYSKAMGHNVAALFQRNKDAVEKAGPSIMTPHIPIITSKKPLLLREVDDHLIRLIGGPSPPFPFPTAHAYYRWASSHTVLDSIRVPFLAINADDDPIVREVPDAAKFSEYVAIVITRGGGHLGWFESSNLSMFSLERWVRKPVLEWLKATAEDVMRDDQPDSKDVEVVEGFCRQIGREDIAFKVISVGEEVDSAGRAIQGL